MEPHPQPPVDALPRRWFGLGLAAFAAAVGIGTLLGVGGFAFRYGEGLSYLSKDPEACVNCHIMRPQFDSWQKASHHGFATCVDCHLPQAFFAKYLAKAEAGFLHSKGFTLQDFPEPIRIRERSMRILQDNCVRCHDALMHGAFVAGQQPADEVRCVHCHRTVGHGDRVGLGKYEPPPAQNR
jgi:cytochrome c nitrite reductase small subunit